MRKEVYNSRQLLVTLFCSISHSNPGLKEMPFLTHVIFALSKKFGGIDMCQKGIFLCNNSSATEDSESA